MELIDSISVVEPSNEFVPVLVNGITIAEQDILQEMQYHPAGSAPVAQQQAARALVVKQLFLKRAEALDINERMMPGESQDEANIRGLLAQEISRPEADDATCRRYYGANPEKFKTPVIIAASHILLAADPADMEGRVRAKAQSKAILNTLATTPEQFVDFAKRYSACPSKNMGGELGQLSKGSTVPEFERQIFSLPQGLAREAIESRYGYHITRVDMRVEGDPLPYDQVADRIASYLRDRVYRQSIHQYVALLAGEASIEGVNIEAAASPLVQ
ncbi:MAG: peptidylprolyl isomerase [Oceanospirillaceae bacterium]|jgi:peptidyl-prolyl cis-trans isomerase C|nr:peptidylprolyl isomerase [Oceanospirillaceae bacterium]MBT4444014.1 peptidylprolyl isomerase [Oceanospirillaceae bacterium]MBT6076348.1 peptidylprolyl isomerase [Oceanospirillaceae bacterium]